MPAAAGSDRDIRPRSLTLQATRRLRADLIQQRREQQKGLGFDLLTQLYWLLAEPAN